MADEVKAAPATTQDVAADAKYTVDELKAAAKKQFGYGPEVIDGATYGKSEPSYTVNEMKALIEEFLKRPAVEKDGEK